jgi:hypothetical protein
MSPVELRLGKLLAHQYRLFGLHASPSSSLRSKLHNDWRVVADIPCVRKVLDSRRDRR